MMMLLKFVFDHVFLYHELKVVVIGEGNCKSSNLGFNLKTIHLAYDVAHLSKRDVQNTMGTRGTPGWHPGLVALVVRRPK